MTNNPRGSIENLREQIEASDSISEDDRENLLRFSDRLDLLQSEYGDQRHEKLLRHCAIMAGQSPRISDEKLSDIELSATLESRDAADEMLRWINNRYQNEETNKDYRLALRIFGKRVNDGDVPDSLSHIPTTTSRDYQPEPDPSDMLDWNEDVKPMIKATRNPRDAALIAVAWDSGARGGEITNLTVGDVTESDNGIRITVDGKKGQRTIFLIPSVSYLNRWLSDHPGEDDGDAPLWSKLNTPEPVSYQLLRKAVRKAAERAGIDKPVTFRNFRKSQASHLASRGMKEAQIKDRLGWSQGSNVASRYVSVFGEDSERALAKIHGKDVDIEEPEPIAPVECPRCGRENPRDRDNCMFCNQVLEVEAVQDIRERQQKVRQAALRLVGDRPELIGEIQRAEDLMTIFEDRPELEAEAEQLVDALDVGGSD
jgi:integrase